MPAPKDIRQLLATARKRGFKVALDGGGHWRITAANGAHATLPRSPRGGKALERSRRTMRRFYADAAR